jgi:hypothetical protein
MNNGWICPECGRVYAPFIPECQHCNGEVKSIINNGTVICDGNKTGIINAKWERVSTRY